MHSILYDTTQLCYHFLFQFLNLSVWNIFSMYEIPHAFKKNTLLLNFHKNRVFFQQTFSSEFIILLMHGLMNNPILIKSGLRILDFVLASYVHISFHGMAGYV